MNAKTLWWIVAVLALVFLALAGEKYRSSLATPSVTETASLAPACDLRKAPCSAVFADGNRVELGITPGHIPLLEPLNLSVKFENALQAGRVEVDFVGTNMDMGFNRSRLNPLDARSFQGQGILPVCTLQRMEWEARVLVHTPNGIKMAAFPFYTIRTSQTP